MSDPERVLDLAGLKCPLPVLKTRQTLLALPKGGVVVVLCTDPMAEIDITELAQNMGAMLLERQKSEGRTLFRIEKR